MKPTRKLVRADGTDTELHGPHALIDVRQLIGADALEIVSLGQRQHAMLIDQSAEAKGLPINAAASHLYQAARGEPRPIHGDVVIVPDTDYAREA